jgi:hypothetical protein
MSRFGEPARRVVLVLALTSLTPVTPAFPQGAPGAERFFKLGWQVEGQAGTEIAIVGSLRNDYLYSLRRLQLQVQVLDDGGHVTGEVVAPVGRDLRPGESTTFRIPVRTPGARYAVLVYAFEFGERESP